MPLVEAVPYDDAHRRDRADRASFTIDLGEILRDAGVTGPKRRTRRRATTTARASSSDMTDQVAKLDRR